MGVETSEFDSQSTQLLYWKVAQEGFVAATYKSISTSLSTNLSTNSEVKYVNIACRQPLVYVKNWVSEVNKYDNLKIWTTSIVLGIASQRKKSQNGR